MCFLFLFVRSFYFSLVFSTSLYTMFQLVTVFSLFNKSNSKVKWIFTMCVFLIFVSYFLADVLFCCSCCCSFSEGWKTTTKKKYICALNNADCLSFRFFCSNICNVVFSLVFSSSPSSSSTFEQSEILNQST